MLKTDKSQRAREICKDMEASVKSWVSVPVIDGGCLLHVMTCNVLANIMVSHQSSFVPRDAMLARY